VHDLNPLSNLPRLYVQVTCLPLSGGLFACSTEVQILQIARLNRDPNIISWGAVTWDISGCRLQILEGEYGTTLETLLTVS
jgi:hypothetical protein